MNFLKTISWGWLALLMCFLSGCGNLPGGETKPTAYRVVCKIEVTYQNGDESAQRSYEKQENMQTILNYLRWIDPYGTPAEDPMTQEGEDFYVQLQYSDGTEKTYHQHCDRYLRIGDGPWKKIDPDRGRKLGELLEDLNREGTSSASEDGPPQPLLLPRLEWE